MESVPSGSTEGGRKNIRCQGWEEIFSVYSFINLEEIGENSFKTVMGVMKNFIPNRNVVFNVIGIIKIAEEKLSSLNKAKRAVR